MANYTLYDYPRSSAAYRVRIALHLKGIAFDSRVIDLRTGAQGEAAYRAVAPAGLVPALILPDGTTLTQSLAIIRYLDTVAAPALYPADPVLAARAEVMALAIACDIHPLNNLRVLHYLKRELGADEGARDAWYAQWVRAGFAALEQQVAADGPYCLGETLSVADLCLVPQMANARRFKVPIDDFPALLRIDATLRALPAFVAAAPGE